MAKVSNLFTKLMYHSQFSPMRAQNLFYAEYNRLEGYKANPHWPMHVALEVDFGGYGNPQYEIEQQWYDLFGFRREYFV